MLESAHNIICCIGSVRECGTLSTEELCQQHTRKQFQMKYSDWFRLFNATQNSCVYIIFINNNKTYSTEPYAANDAPGNPWVIILPFPITRRGIWMF
ncbi:hypothetical protein TNIN_193321 [Trichonephila inaurata madagascariensis]|uniref:Uncharacterized protein n=1 Tax=Trichonephila inaurata madagascariensis TaxID=2747483 RepID=A0A8X6MF63_9ARAC|nr:hypothetical protein TNIN_193321 [Trichonephila inaurata madagascariensis]